ncbi:MAG: hypothetical protein C4547_03140 [Phycisphaerales bacterium]|nr:MAG: hypothetical protein C4547_03140 [Phycisphaerales bacterium]
MATTTMAAPLTDEQRELVERNLGLVAVHLRRHVANLAQPRREREWDDLFQEGTLGLIQAARKFRPDGQIPFAAFALPRIHHAVSKALRLRFTLVRGPEGPGGDEPDPAAASRADRPHPRHVPTVSLLSDDPIDRRPPRPKIDAAVGSGTVGQRIWEKHTRAVRRVATALKRARGAKADRAALIDVLMEERALVAEPHERTPLRQIARQTASSYARVAQTDKQIRDGLRAALEGDPEFSMLATLVRERDEAADVPLDAEVERRLADAVGEAFLARFEAADAPARDALAYRLLAAHCGGDFARFIRATFRRLDPVAREMLLAGD